jgi:condensin complex subunit 3
MTWSAGPSSLLISPNGPTAAKSSAQLNSVSTAKPAHPPKPKSHTCTCSKDERKPLLSLLSKLFIAPSFSSSTKSDDAEENLTTLHGLVAEAVEGKLGTDATQRNYLAKLELSLTKRLGDVELVTQVADQSSHSEGTVVAPPEHDVSQMSLPDRTVAPGNADGDVEMSVDGSEVGEDEDDTMLAGMQAEGTRMPLESEGEEEEEEEDEEDELPTPRKPYHGVTEDDIMESLLASEM